MSCSSISAERPPAIASPPSRRRRCYGSDLHRAQRQCDVPAARVGGTRTPLRRHRRPRRGRAGTVRCPPPAAGSRGASLRRTPQRRLPATRRGRGARRGRSWPAPRIHRRRGRRRSRRDRGTRTASARGTPADRRGTPGSWHRDSGPEVVVLDRPPHRELEAPSRAQHARRLRRTPATSRGRTWHRTGTRPRRRSRRRRATTVRRRHPT